MKRFVLAAVVAALVPAGSAQANGVYSSTEADPAAIRSLGFEFAIASGYRENLDRFWAAGLKTLVWLGGYSQDDCSFSWDDDKIRERIAEIEGHPGIYAYFLDDEPHNECPDTPGQVRQRNQLVKQLDPGVTTLFTENRPEDYAALANTTDVMGLVTYPCNVEDGCNQGEIAEEARIAEQAGVRRYWGVTQSFGDEYYKLPTPAELQSIIDEWNATRSEQHLAYTWDDNISVLRDAPELWDVWRRENARPRPDVPGPHPPGGGDPTGLPRIGATSAPASEPGAASHGYGSCG